MNAADYRRRCAQPDVMRRSHLRATVARLATHQPALAERVAALLARPAIPKPPEHDSGVESDFLPLELSADEIAQVVEALGDLEVGLADANAPAGPLSAAGELVDRWNRAESARPAT